MGKAERLNPTNQLRAAAASGVNKFGVYDRFMHEVQEGDIVFLLGKQDIFWRIAKIAPVLRPDAPMGTMEVSLVAMFLTGVPGATPIMDMLKVRSAAEVQGSLAAVQQMAQQAVPDVPAPPPPAAPADPVGPDGEP